MIDAINAIAVGFRIVFFRLTYLRSRVMIAEPWDVGPYGYQVGAFGHGWSEWNDKYRDGVRKYWRGDPGLRPEMAARMSGSGDLFDRRFYANFKIGLMF